MRQLEKEQEFNNLIEDVTRFISEEASGKSGYSG